MHDFVQLCSIFYLNPFVAALMLIIFQYSFYDSRELISVFVLTIATHRSLAAVKRRRKYKNDKKKKKIRLAKEKVIEEKALKEANTKKALTECIHLKHEIKLYKVAYGNVLKKLKQKDFKTISDTPYLHKERNKATVSLIYKDDKFKFLSSKLPSVPLLSTAVIEFPTTDNVLGEGVFGRVTQAKFLTLDIPVAVKQGKNGSFSAVSEARILQRLSGNQCFPYVFGVCNNKLIMELVAHYDGFKYSTITLSERLSSSDVSPPTYWHSLCYQMANAVKFMHSCLILHNDIKGDNVLLKENDSICIPKITDFGKATHAHNPASYDLSEKDKEKYNLRHRHLAFELRNVKGSKQSNSSDIYSLGRLLKIIGYHTGIEHLKRNGLAMMHKDPDRRPGLISIMKDMSLWKQS